MTKIVLGILVASALGAIYSSFINRQLAYEWQALNDQQTKLVEEHGRLMLEYSTLAAPSRIEVLARDKLNMKFPQKEDQRVIEMHPSGEGLKPKL